MSIAPFMITRWTKVGRAAIFEEYMDPEFGCLCDRPGNDRGGILRSKQNYLYLY